MKKLMIVAAIVCAATFSKAATITWGGAIADPKYATSRSYDDYQAYPATAMLLWSSTAMSAATEIDGIDVGAKANNGGQVVQTFDISAEEASNKWAFSVDYDKVGQAANGYYAVLVTNGDETKASYYDIGSVSGDETTTKDLSVNPGWSSSDFLEQGGYTVDIVTTPEPTSGLLLLLGMGALALRRRRA